MMNKDNVKIIVIYFAICFILGFVFLGRFLHISNYYSGLCGLIIGASIVLLDKFVFHWYM